MPRYAGLGLTTVARAEGVTPGGAFGIEFLITFVLVATVFASAADENNAPNVKGSAPLAIGIAVAIGHLFAVSYYLF